VLGMGLPFTKTILFGEASSPPSDSGADPFHDRAIGNGKESCTYRKNAMQITSVKKEKPPKNSTIFPHSQLTVNLPDRCMQRAKIQLPQTPGL
jgi:hypothetical protein